MSWSVFFVDRQTDRQADTEAEKPTETKTETERATIKLKLHVLAAFQSKRNKHI